MNSEYKPPIVMLHYRLTGTVRANGIRHLLFSLSLMGLMARLIKVLGKDCGSQT